MNDIKIQLDPTKITSATKEVFFYNDREYPSRAAAERAEAEDRIKKLIDEHGGYSDYRNWVASFVEEFGARLIEPLTILHRHN